MKPNHIDPVDLDIVVRYTRNPAKLEQLAEECTELAHAALKFARLMRGENPTPVDYPSAKNNLIEEIADVRLCILVIEEALGESFETADIEEKKTDSMGTANQRI